MEEITYGALKKPVARKEMLSNDVLRLGTQAGNYGLFTEEARILTINGANKIKSELVVFCTEEGLDFDSVMEFAPTLRGLIG
tara:strand:- start:475 stop:720 length:246 start_codon:yes stop_codon:yes gene_type:complete